MISLNVCGCVQIQMRRSLVLLAAALLALLELLHATTPPAARPHPRLFLTPTNLAKMPGTTDYTRAKSTCDATIADPTNPDYLYMK